MYPENYIKYLVILFINVLILPCHAEKALTDDEILNKIEALYRSYSDIKAEFRQESYNSTSETTKKLSGFYYAKRPNLMRWEYLKPDEQYFIVDGKFLWFYTVKDNQVFKNDIQKTDEGIKMFIEFFSSIKKIKDDFNISNVKNEEELIFEFHPKHQMTGLSKLVVYFKPKSFEIIKTMQFDHFNNRNTIYFEKTESNIGLKDEKFRFEVPKGVEVIEN